MATGWGALQTLTTSIISNDDGRFVLKMSVMRAGSWYGLCLVCGGWHQRRFYWWPKWFMWGCFKEEPSRNHKQTPDIIKFIIKRLSNLGHGEEIEMSFENKNLFWFVSENPDSKKEFNWTGLEFTNLCWSFEAMKFCLTKWKYLHKDRKYFRSFGCGIFDLRQDNNTSWKE